MYTALYRAERPEVFDQVLGQEHIVKVLKHQIAEGRVGHAYLFCGTRGTGKTTLARILAKGVNCQDPDVNGRPCGKCANCEAIRQGNFLDVIEIDAASNNGVDAIRELRESVKYPPVLGKKKIYIIDEVHMLSTSGANALLKTLEEPPEYVTFIMATTDPQKLPQTILSRCMKFDFKRVPQAQIKADMRRICTEKGVKISDSALGLLASCADGSVRDGLSILDQVLASGEKEIRREDVLDYVGSAGEDFFRELTECVLLKNVSEALVLLDKVLADGKDVRNLLKDWMAYYRNLMIVKFVKSPEDLINMSTENVQLIKEQSEHISMDEINDAIVTLSKATADARYSTQPRILMELAIVNLASGVGAKLITPPRTAGYGAPAGGNAYAVQQTVATGAGTQVVSQSVAPPSVAETGTGKVSREASNVANRAGNASPATVSSKKSRAVPLDAGEHAEEYDRLWNDVFDSGESEAGSLNTIRPSTRLVHIGEKSFTIVAKTDFARRIAMDRRELVENIMSAKLGRRCEMVCILESELAAQAAVLKDAGGSAGVAADSTEKSDADRQSELEENERLAKEASEILGVEIEVV